MKTITPVERLKLNSAQDSKDNLKNWQDKAVEELVSDKIDKLKDDAIVALNKSLQDLNNHQKIEFLYSKKGDSKNALIEDCSEKFKLKGVKLEDKMISEQLSKMRIEAYEKVEDKFNGMSAIEKVATLNNVSTDEAKTQIQDVAKKHFTVDFKNAQAGLARVEVSRKKAIEMLERAKDKSKTMSTSKN